MSCENCSAYNDCTQHDFDHCDVEAERQDSYPEEPLDDGVSDDNWACGTLDVNT